MFLVFKWTLPNHCALKKIRWEYSFPTPIYLSKMTNTMNGFLSRLMSDPNHICSVPFNICYVCQSSKEQNHLKKKLVLMIMKVVVGLVAIGNKEEIIRWDKAHRTGLIIIKKTYILILIILILLENLYWSFP